MNKLKQLSLVVLITAFTACSSDYGDPHGDEGSGQASSGVLTAAEWNDLNQYSFWSDLMQGNGSYYHHTGNWSIYPTDNRISVQVEYNGVDAANVPVELKLNNTTIWAGITDNLGRAELWNGLFNNTYDSSLTAFELYVDGEIWPNQINYYKDGVNQVSLSNYNAPSNKVQVCLIVDATGSMTDEIDFLKEDLKEVILRVKNQNSQLNMETGAVFYRDLADQYVSRVSGFSSDVQTTVDFINDQDAGGGGDFPEAVHVGLDRAVNDLSWSGNAKTRIAFLLLDAPPHNNNEVMNQLRGDIEKAAEKGIKIIPIVASGIDKETEFLMRFMALSTNGTYVFITDDSGVGNSHISPTVGEYQIEPLNDLMYRLIKKYSN